MLRAFSTTSASQEDIEALSAPAREWRSSADDENPTRDRLGRRCESFGQVGGRKRLPRVTRLSFQRLSGRIRVPRVAFPAKGHLTQICANKTPGHRITQNAENEPSERKNRIWQII